MGDGDLRPVPHAGQCEAAAGGSDFPRTRPGCFTGRFQRAGRGRVDLSAVGAGDVGDFLHAVDDLAPYDRTGDAFGFDLA